LKLIDVLLKLASPSIYPPFPSRTPLYIVQNIGNVIVIHHKEHLDSDAHGPLSPVGILPSYPRYLSAHYNPSPGPICALLHLLPKQIHTDQSAQL